MNKIAPANPNLFTALHGLHNSIQIARGSVVIEELAKSDLDSELLDLLHRVSPYNPHPELQQERDGCELIKQFEEFLLTKSGELNNDFKKVFTDQRYKNDLKTWSKKLSQDPNQISALRFLLRKMSTTNNLAEKLFMKASANILQDGLLEGFTDKTLLTQYINALPAEELAKIIRDAYPDKLKHDLINDLVIAIQKRKDFNVVIENLIGCAHMHKQEERESQQAYKEHYAPWVYDYYRASLITKLLTGQSKNIDSKILTKLGAELYILAYDYSKITYDKNYPTERDRNYFRNEEVDIVEFLQNNTPREVYKGILLQVINDSRLAPVIRVKALEKILELRNETKETKKNLCLKILQQAPDEEKISSGLVHDAALYLIDQGEYQVLIDSIVNEAKQNDGKSLILYASIFTKFYDYEKHREFRQELLAKIPNLMLLIKNSTDTYSEQKSLPMLHLDQFDSNFPFIDLLKLNFLAKQLMESYDQILQANIIDIFKELDKHEIERLLELADENTDVKRLLGYLDEIFDVQD